MTPLIPLMTAANAPSGTASASTQYPGTTGNGGAVQYPWNAFDRSNATAWFANAATGSVEYDFPTPCTPASYSIVGWSTAGASNTQARSPKSWSLQALVSGAWATLDSRTTITFADGVAQTFAIASPVSASSFRLNVSENHGDGLLIVVQLQLLAAAPPDTSGNMLIQGSVSFPLPALPSSDLLAGTVPALPAVEGYSGTSYANLVGAQNNAQAALSANGGAVFVIGDSIVTMLDVRQIPGGFNAGIGADSFAGVLNRLAGYTALHNGYAIVLLCGHNNAYFGQTLANMQDHFARIVNWRTGRFVWVPIPPSTATGSALMVQFNTWAASYLAVLPNVSIADLTGFDPATDTTDGTHPNVSGAAKIVKAIRGALNTIQ